MSDTAFASVKFAVAGIGSYEKSVIGEVPVVEYIKLLSIDAILEKPEDIPIPEEGDRIFVENTGTFHEFKGSRWVNTGRTE